MMIRTTLITLRRIFTEKSCLLCCAFVFALCFTASVGVAENGDPLNVLSYVFGGEKNPPSADMIINSRGGSWLAMFLPIISGLCFANVICDDKSSKYTRCEVIRTGFYKLKAAKFLSALVSSGIVMAVGFAAFSFFIRSYFPKDGFVEINLAVIIAEMFIYGIMSAIPALIATAFTNNKYLIVCVPFLLKYVLSQFAYKLSNDAYEDLWHPDLALAKLGMLIAPDSVSFVFTYPYKLEIIMINAVLLLGGGAVYLFVKGGVDKGE